jgi:serine/threonine protein kinase
MRRHHVGPAHIDRVRADAQVELQRSPDHELRNPIDEQGRARWPRTHAYRYVPSACAIGDRARERVAHRRAEVRLVELELCVGGGRERVAIRVATLCPHERELGQRARDGRLTCPRGRVLRRVQRDGAGFGIARRHEARACFVDRTTQIFLRVRERGELALVGRGLGIDQRDREARGREAHARNGHIACGGIAHDQRDARLRARHASEPGDTKCYHRHAQSMSLTFPPGYTLIRPVGAGGMAELYLVEKAALGGTRRQVVLKCILPGFARDPTFREMFVNEARVAMQLSHANIVQVHDLREVDGSYVIEMEYVAGTDLTHLVRSEKLPIDSALYVASALLRALGYAHRQHAADGRSLDLVHRDVTPGNILLSTEGEVKLTDFGLARSRDRVGRSIAGVKGTFAFMSPEQAEGRHVDARADLFAVGAVLYAMLAGESPFEGGGPAATLDRVREVRYAPLDAALDLGDIFARSLAREPEARFADADAMRVAIEELAAQKGLRLGPDALAVRVRTLVASTKASTKATVEPVAAFGATAMPTDSATPTSDAPISETEAPLRLAGGTRAMAKRPKGRSGARFAAAFMGCALLVSGFFYLRSHLGIFPHGPPPVRTPPPVAPPPPKAPSVVTPVVDPRVVPAAAEAIVKRPGYVTVSSDPWAYVTIDGKKRGTTPLLDVEVAPGVHEVQLENPPLGAVKHLHVRVRPGEHKKVIENLSREEP